MTGLPLLPSTLARLHEHMEPGFVRVPDIGPGWFVLGPDWKVIPGRECLVRRRSDNTMVRVQLGDLAAERVVSHRPGSRYGVGEKRYVLVKVEPPKRRADAKSTSRAEWLHGGS